MSTAALGEEAGRNSSAASAKPSPPAGMRSNSPMRGPASNAFGLCVLDQGWFSSPARASVEGRVERRDAGETRVLAGGERLAAGQGIPGNPRQHVGEESRIRFP